MGKVLAVGSNQDKILHVTPRQETLLLKKLEKLDDVNTELELMRKRYEERMKTCNEIRVILENRQKSLKFDMEKFKTFIEENAQKRRRSRIKYEQESRMVDQYEREIGCLEKELKKLKDRYDWLYNTSENYQPVIRYLNSIVEQLPKDYLKQSDDPLKALILRFDNLGFKRNAFQDSLKKMTDDKTMLELEEEEIDKRQNLRIFQMSSTISKLYSIKDEQTKHKAAKISAESPIETLRRQITDFGIIIRAIDNICEKSVREFDTTDHSTWTLENKLTRVKMNIQNSESIIAKVKNKLGNK